MHYFSTREKNIVVSPSEAIVKGISEDGGLFVPEMIPKMDSVESMIHMTYKELAYEIMRRYFTDMEKNALLTAIDQAYDEKFTNKNIAPLVEVGEEYYLELFHGPTLAFKDIALSILPHLLIEAIKNTTERKEIVILTATSGDTGKAALESFGGISGIKIIVFFPEKGVSLIQKQQMVTHEGSNTFVVSINGDFDDAQTGVKKLMNDEQLIELLEKNDYRLSSANSINIGRLVPQIVYYYQSYIHLLKKKKIKKDEKINVVVPTGNFGNILAAYYAKEMGLPIHKLICSSNENKVLTDFINTGIYDNKRELKLTSSPSMDILTSSNLERLLFHLSGGNSTKIKKYMEKLESTGEYEIEGIDLGDFKGYFSSEEDTSHSIKEVFQKHHYLIDPHTAVAYSAYKKYKEETKDSTQTIIVSTASPFKFSESVAESLALNTANKDIFTLIEELSRLSNVEIPRNLLCLKEKEIIHAINCDVKDMKENVLSLLKRGEPHD